MNNKALLDIVFHGKGLSDGQFSEVKEEILTSMSESPMGESMLEELWNECEGTPVSRADIKGLKRLHRNLKRQKPAGLAIAAAIVAAVAVTFFATFLTFQHFSQDYKETTIIAARGSRGVYTLPDGTVVHLNGGSSLTFNDSFNQQDRRAEICGSAFFDVAKDQEKPFILEMNNMRLTVLGTSFTVINEPSLGKEEIILRSGSVEVESQDQHIIMSPGEKIALNTRGEMEKYAVNASQMCKWWEDCMIFDNATLTDVLSCMEIRYQMDIMNNSSLPSDTRLSMTITDESVNDIMAMLSMMLPIRYSIFENSILINNQ